MHWRRSVLGSGRIVAWFRQDRTGRWTGFCQTPDELARCICAGSSPLVGLHVLLPPWVPMETHDCSSPAASPRACPAPPTPARVSRTGRTQSLVESPTGRRKTLDRKLSDNKEKRKEANMKTDFQPVSPSRLHTGRGKGSLKSDRTVKTVAAQMLGCNCRGRKIKLHWASPASHAASPCGPTPSAISYPQALHQPWLFRASISDVSQCWSPPPTPVAAPAPHPNQYNGPTPVPRQQHAYKRSKRSEIYRKPSIQEISSAHANLANSVSLSS